MAVECQIVIISLAGLVSISLLCARATALWPRERQEERPSWPEHRDRLDIALYSQNHNHHPSHEGMCDA